VARHPRAPPIDLARTDLARTDLARTDLARTDLAAAALPGWQTGSCLPPETATRGTFENGRNEP
jgi:hypothetical protein